MTDKDRILHGPYIATLFVSSDTPPIHHAIITKADSTRIVAWLQCPTREDCERKVLEELKLLNGLKTSALFLFPPIPASNLRKLAHRKKKKAKRKSA
jgi:hypothetical protein